MNSRIDGTKYSDIIDLILSNSTICTFLDCKSKKGAILRHDIDADLDTAVRMAEFESKLGVKSTYFILHTAKYFDRSKQFVNKCRKLQDLGHDIGLHNNVITVSSRKGIPAKKIVKGLLEFLRANGLLIEGTSSHGDAQCYKKGYQNYELWVEHNYKKIEGGTSVLPQKHSLSLKEFGLKYEADFIDHSFYLDDSACQWNGMIVKDKRLYGRSLMSSKFNIGKKVLVEWMNSESGILQILTHPCWWAIQ